MVHGNIRNSQVELKIFRYGTTDRQFLAPEVNGTVFVKAPASTGKFTAYYCINNGYFCIANVDFEVESPKVTCRRKGDTASSIKNVIIIISENHSFDNYYGNYCKAPPKSSPVCNVGRECCERAAREFPFEPTVLNDKTNLLYDPTHDYESEKCKINNGKMDRFASSGKCPRSYQQALEMYSSNDKTIAFADGTVGSASRYWHWAENYAMSDRFFQSAVGASSENDMYFARGGWVFKDNWVVPLSYNRNLPYKTKMSYDDPTIADLLLKCDVSFTFYAEGYTTNQSPDDRWPHQYDASDNPFQYFSSLTNHANSNEIFKNFNSFETDIQKGTLPSVSYLKALGINSEHPGYSTISSGERFNDKVIDLVMNSTLYSNNTLIILVPDESGGFYDSIAPPPTNPLDSRPYGPRTSFLLVGAAAKKNYISHEILEPASIIRFLETNYFDDKLPGQLQTRDAVVKNIGSLLDRNITGFDFL
ncbi:phosphoesterase family-domain-containing protein [Globomyces pollinis-pini]|nr:phosphoesterase family-domain-containing protein [Globomyces pollinis-pini]